jgi:hypothetical protein
VRKEPKWVTGKALLTVFDLNEIRPGDEIKLGDRLVNRRMEPGARCRVHYRGKTFVVRFIDPDKDQAYPIELEDGPTTCVEHIVAWRRPVK